MSSRTVRAALWSGLILAAGSLAGVLLGPSRGRHDLLGDLTRETRDLGVSDLRLSVVSGLRPCTPKESGCVGAPARPSKHALAVIRRAVEAARAGVDADALHAAGAAILVYSGDAGNSLDQAISYLQSASRLTERPAPVLADLAAAHLKRARATGSAWELYQALEAADRALEHEPSDPAALFNAAAALEGIGDAAGASGGWSRYLMSDSTSGWATEARTRRSALRQSPSQPRLGRNASPAELRAFAVAFPKEARELGWDQLLREWGAAVLAGDSATARARLNQAAGLGGVLAGEARDASLLDGVEALRGYDGPATGLRELARAHVALGEGREFQLDLDYGGACPRFESASRATPQVLREWARTFVAMCELNTPELELLPRLERLAAACDSVRYPALAGRRWLVLGNARAFRGQYEGALAAYRQADGLLQRAGEQEYAAGARMQIGNTWAALGQREESYASLHESLDVLRQSPGSLGLWNGLFALRNALLADGLSRAAMHVQDEAVMVAETMPPQFRAEIRLARTRLRLAVGRHDIASDVQEAVKIMRTMNEQFLKGYLVADLRQTLAEARLAEDPAGALVELDSAVSHFAGNPERLLPALLLRAQAGLASGREGEAALDLERAMAVLDTQRTHVNSAPLRASLLEQSRGVFDRAVMLSVRAGENREALDFLERSRASFSPVGHATDWARRRLQVPRGQVAVEFALVGDTLLSWTLWTGGVRLTRHTVSRVELMRRVERVRSALELRASDAVVMPWLESLYDELLRPLQAYLGPAGTPLVIVADGELAALPLAALRDRVQARYLVEDHPVRFVSSLRDPPAADTRSVAGFTVTLVADPAFDAAVFPGLEPLGGARAEVAAVERLYGRAARVLDGHRADAAAVRAAFLRGGIAHFAGHAVFDDARPERSYLVTAGRGGAPVARVTAAEIERMDLRTLRLVVLSACQTARAQEGRSGGFAGLAGAFLAAGAGGVVGSLWRVDDQATRTLMEHFHARYHVSGNASESLRQAQLRMLRSTDPALRSPAAWAGFRYAGG